MSKDDFVVLALPVPLQPKFPFWQEVAKECNISCMPTFQFFKNGSKVAEFSGADESKLEKMITDNK
jgi:hypothetical protein